VPGLTDVKQVAGDMEAGYALRQDGTVWAVGRTGRTNGYTLHPTQVRGLSGIVSIAAGNRQGFAVKQDGTVWRWSETLTATQVDGLSDVTQITGGPVSHLVLRRDATVWYWSELGPAPYQLTMPGRITSIASSGVARFVVRDDGTLWAWGTNYSGELGLGTEATRVDEPTQVALTGVVKVAVSMNQSTYAIKSDGTLWAWGSAFLSGQTTPPGGPYHYTTPQQVPALSHVAEVVAGWNYALALTTDGAVWAWGSLSFAEALKTPDMRPQETPTKVPGLDGLHVTDISAGGYQAYIAASS
jgi:alpha-tubulin suppressor-like RCC1 family protein